jgi:hypothetical protein
MRVPHEDETLEAFHQARCVHEASSPGTAHRLMSFVELVSAELALRNRLGQGYLEKLAHSPGQKPFLWETS